MQNAERRQECPRVLRSAFCIHRSAFPRSGFTLIECLATMLLMAIVLPVAVEGINSTLRSADSTRNRTEAAGLAQSKLSELIVGGSAVWSSGGLSGDFGADWPGYRWSAAVSPWINDTQNVGLEQLDVTVTWSARNKSQSLTVSGLVYTRPVPSS
jgi:prepilin-type N-terminal cleavage/methylation domain-containing protein